MTITLGVHTESKEPTYFKCYIASRVIRGRASTFGYRNGCTSLGGFFVINNNYKINGILNSLGICEIRANVKEVLGIKLLSATSLFRNLLQTETYRYVSI